MIRADQLALNGALTKEVLLKEVFGDQNTFLVERQKELVLYDLKRQFELFPALKEMCDERFMIYSFIRLWEEGRVRKLKFGRMWQAYVYLVLTVYLEDYNKYLKSTQDTFGI